eukprot:7672765-Prorocentrum_lima.AAC.1
MIFSFCPAGLHSGSSADMASEGAAATPMRSSSASFASWGLFLDFRLFSGRSCRCHAAATSTKR